jgi:hypothetical protein
MSSRGSSSHVRDLVLASGAIVVSYGVQRLFALFRIISQRLDDRRRGSRRHSAIVVWYSVPSFSLLHKASCAGAETIDVATLGVGHTTSCCIASRGSSSFCSDCNVGVGTKGVAAFSVGFLVSCSVASRCFFSLCSKFLVGVSIVGVGQQISCRDGVPRLHNFGLFGILSRRPDNRRHDARCRSVNVESYGVPRLHFALFVILCLRRDDTRRLASVG